MKPKSKLEHLIVAISDSLPVITQNQHKLAFSKCFSRYAVLSRNTIFCLECGHNWKSENSIRNSKAICPNCFQKLEFTDKYSNGLKEIDYYQIVTTQQDFQIIRMVCISKTMKKLQKPSYFAHEVMQIFILPDGSMRYLSKNVMGLSMYIDQWVISSELVLKPNYDTPRLRLAPSYILPYAKVLPRLIRILLEGFKKR